MTIENVGGIDVQMTQKTNYPWDGKVSITVNPSRRQTFSVRIRVPDRNVSATGERAIASTLRFR